MSESSSSFIRLGAAQREMLMDGLKAGGPFNEGLHACRLAVVLSMMNDFAELPLEAAINVYHAGTFDDSDRTFVVSLMELTDTPEDEVLVWAKLSRMANWGVTQLHKAMRGNDIAFRRLLEDPER